MKKNGFLIYGAVLIFALSLNNFVHAAGKMAIFNPNPSPVPKFTASASTPGLGASLVTTAPVTATEGFNEGLPKEQESIKLSPPFGANLFSGEFHAGRDQDLDPDYRLLPGDKVSIHMWGTVDANVEVIVDSKGNIFIPQVGELHVQNVRAADLADLVKQKVNSVYSDGVEEVYASLMSSTPISVFVTGAAVSPGQYPGFLSDSVLAFLSRAGGVHPERGSYRDIKIVRKGKAVKYVDLYPFLIDGKLDRAYLQDGDTIVVGQQGATINVEEGDSRNPFRFEMTKKRSTGKELVKYARPYSKVTHAAVTGTRNHEPWSVYLTYDQFLKVGLEDGDRVRFVSDARAPVIDVSVQGSYLGSSYFPVNKGTHLRELLDYVAVDPDDADIGNIYIKRKSVAALQRETLLATIHRLERAILTAPASSDGEASIRAQESDMILKFITDAKQIEPDGRVVVSEAGRPANIRLEDGDVIVIPQKTDVVTIGGEVQMPQAIVYAKNANILDYIVRAGGFTYRADTEQFVIIRPNGKVEIGNKLSVEMGDQILVFPKIDPKNMQFAKDLTQIIYQVAIATIAVSRF
ncbi:MAG: polysaccharide biosynthesis/export family protein [Gammaproteobacteria bacterium]